MEYTEILNWLYENMGIIILVLVLVIGIWVSKRKKKVKIPDGPVKFDDVFGTPVSHGDRITEQLAIINKEIEIGKQRLVEAKKRYDEILQTGDSIKKHLEALYKQKTVFEESKK